MTHDLLLSSVHTLGAAIERIVISDLKDSTFFAVIHLDRKGEKISLDSRPSDAIALALRAEAPIFVLRAVLEKAKAVDVDSDATEEERIRKMLEELGPEDLGKYTM
jgi:bifunctional DNase/RNase